MEPLRVGLVGCSWFALRAHIPALLALEQGGCRGFAVRIEAVCSRTRWLRSRAAERSQSGGGASLGAAAAVATSCACTYRRAWSTHDMVDHEAAAAGNGYGPKLHTNR